MLCAKAIRISIAKVLIPCPHQSVHILFHNPMKLTDLIPAEPSAVVQSDRVEPEFGHRILSLDMHVSRFIPVTSIEEKPLGTNT